MTLNGILTTRNYNTWPSYDIVYEWEDIIANKLTLSLIEENEILTNRIIRCVPYLGKVIQTNINTFTYEMFPTLKNRYNNKKNIIPCIIDFYLKENDFEKFTKSYLNNQLICISSKEVYELLKKSSICKSLNIAHLPLSISDKYRITPTTYFDKKYDLVLMGRQNPVLESFLEKYLREHKDLNYVYRVQKNDEFLYYNSKGECLGNINTREKYISLMKKAKCGLYATPGIDGGEKRTNGYNQVTPRFLELVACGCHIIARYPQNPDTEYYELANFSKSINSYDDFEKALDFARNNDVCMTKYSKYLEQHYTTKRTKELFNLILNI